MTGPPHSLRFEGSRFWVTHRRREYGPFDYEWSPDFCGMEFQYCGEKFGEYCGLEEYYADLRPHDLPMSVVEVATITLGSVVAGVLKGLTESQRCELVAATLRQFGYARFVNEPADPLDNARPDCEP